MALVLISCVSSGGSLMISDPGANVGSPQIREAKMEADGRSGWINLLIPQEQQLTDSDREFNEQKRLFETIPPLLLEQYRGQFVASRDGMVVDSDDDFVTLTHRFFQDAGDVPVYITKIGHDDGIFIETPFSD
jgi:hypothetical protein